MQAITVFCGASNGHDPIYMKQARHLGTALASRGISLVYGGSHTGLMGAIADACLLAGGEVIGVIPEHMVGKEVAHQGLSKLHIVDSMHSRKALMASLGDGFIAMPGGFGTLDEMCEIITWAQLGLHQKPIAFYNINHYYDAFVKFYQDCATQGFINPAQTHALIVSEDIPDLLQQMNHWKGLPTKPAASAP